MQADSGEGDMQGPFVRTVLLTAALCCASAVATTAATAFVVDPASAASGIAIAKMTLVTITGGGGASECVFFTNTTKHAATHIAFAFDTMNGNGTVTQTDAFDRWGTIAPGVRNEGMETARQLFSGSAHGRLKNCRDRYVRREPVKIRVRIVSVDYDDGSSWHAPAAVSNPTAHPAGGLP